MNERDFFRIIKEHGGRAYLVGGAVRDRLMGREPRDRDYVVCGMTREDFRAAFPGAATAGRSFPVFLLDIGGEVCDVAFARLERKTGRGHAGFETTCGLPITIERDLARRDTTINSMAADEGGRLIDPFGGAEDIKKKVIRAVSRHFTEDPLRALRAARQSAEYGFSIEPRTLCLMGQCAEELRSEPAERKFAELQKALASSAPSLYFRALADAGLLAGEFPWIAAMSGKSLKPGGDAFGHTMDVISFAARRGASAEAVFAALLHGIDKGTAREDMPLPRYGHEPCGLALLSEIAESLKIPKRWRRCAEFVIKEGGRAARAASPPEISALVRALANAPLSVRDFQIIAAADNRGKLPDWLARFDEYLSVVKSAARAHIPKGLSGAERGEYIRRRETEALSKFMESEKS